MHEKRLLTNPFKKFLQNILIGLFLVILTFGGVFFGGQIFNTGNKIDEDVEAGALNNMDVWIAQKVHYDKYGNSVNKARIILTSSGGSRDVGVACTAVAFWSYDEDVNSTFYYQTSVKEEAYTYWSQNQKHVITKFKPSQYSWVGVKD